MKAKPGIHRCHLPRVLTTFRAWGWSLTFAAAFVSNIFAAGQAKYFILIVWDGMRPDFVTPELTPTLYKLRNEGVWFANHHSVYPPTTEVNGAALATGCFPQQNGIVANDEYRPEINPLKQVAMQDLKIVRRGDELTKGRYLRVPTVAELVQAQELHTVVVGAKAVALLHDRRGREPGSLGEIFFAGQCLPPSRLVDFTNRFGPFPKFSAPNTPRNEFATRCLIEGYWSREIPRYTVLWLSEPDVSQHQFGPGSPQALTAIRNSDDRLASVLSELERRGAREQTDLFVVSDHGFSTVAANMSVEATLQSAGLNARAEWPQPPQKDDVIVVGDGGTVMIYVKGKSRAVIRKVVHILQRQPFTGVLFTRNGIDGTFAFKEAGIATAQAPDVVLATYWTRAASDGSHQRVEIYSDGYKEYPAGTGMHGTLSPLDLHNLAIAAGPDFRHGITNSLPSGNVDVAPTLLWLMGIKPRSKLDGRVLSEGLIVKGPAVGKAHESQRTARLPSAKGVWEQYLKFTELNGVRYLDEGNGSWTPSHNIDKSRN